MPKQIIILLGVILLVVDVVQCVVSNTFEDLAVASVNLIQNQVKIELDRDVVSSLGGYSGSHGQSLSAIQNAVTGVLSNDTLVVTKLLELGGASALEMFDTFLPTLMKIYHDGGSFSRKFINNLMSTLFAQILVPCDIIHKLQKLIGLVSPDVAVQNQQALDILSNEVRNFGNVMDTFLKSFRNMSQIPIAILSGCVPKLNIITVQIVSNPCMALCAVIQKSQLPVLEEAAKKQKLCGGIPFCNMANEVFVKSAANTVYNSVKLVPNRLGDLIKLLVQHSNDFFQCLP